MPQTVTYNVVDTTPPGVMLVSDADGVENSGEMVIVQSSEAGTVYLVSDSVTVTDLNSLTNAADNLVNSVAVAANVGTVLALNGLAEGTYHAYAVDASGNVSAISGSSVTVDNTAPVLTSSTPQDNGGSIATGANLTLTFSEDVLAGSGHITLVNESDSSQNKVIDITDSSQVSISGNTVTIDPTTDLAAGANYHVQIDSTALHDTAGNDYAGISSSAGLNFTTVSASTVDPSIVVFDLTTGQSSDHNGRVFDANTAYTIYIQVNSSYNSTLAGLDSNEMWSGAQNLGADDKIVLVGTGSDVQGRYGDPVMTMRHGGNSVNWLAGFSISFSSYNVAGVDASGKFSRDGNNVDLWNGTWTVNPNEDNGFAQAYLKEMPAGVLTSQGLAMP